MRDEQKCWQMLGAIPLHLRDDTERGGLAQPLYSKVTSVPDIPKKALVEKPKDTIHVLQVYKYSRLR